MQYIDGIQFLTLCISKEFHLSIQIAFVLEGHLKVLTRKAGLQGIIYNGGLSH